MLFTPMLIQLLVSCASEETVKVFNNTPTVVITSHSSGEIFQDGYEVRFQAQVQDDNHDSSTLEVQWNSDTRTLCEPQAPASDGISQCTVTLQEGESIIRAQVTDPEGAAAIGEISIEVEATSAPTVQITSPSTTGLYYSDQLILFSANIQDTEDAPSDLTYTWESSLDGPLPANATANEDGLLEEYMYLSEGTHALTLAVTDLSGKTTERSISLNVGGTNTNPACSITAPANGDVFLVGESITFQATMSDAEVSIDDLQVMWKSDKDGDLGEGIVNSSGEVQLSTSALSANEHIIQFLVQDELESSCSNSIVITVEEEGNAPQLTLLSPTDGDVVEYGSSVRFEATISDNEDTPQDITLAWVSDLDGVLENPIPNSNGEIEFNKANLSAGLHSITATATDSTGLVDSELFELRVNQLPVAPTVSISPSVIHTSDDIFASPAETTDADGQTVSYTYEWYKNSTLTTNTGTFLSSTETAKGEYWTVRVIPSDGYQTGPFTESTVTIQNTAPVIDSLTVDATQATTSQTVLCSGTSSAADAETLSESYVWTNETTGVPLGSSDTLILSPLSVSPGDSVSCTYTVSDGTDSVSQDTILSVINTDPVIDSLTVVPSIPYLDDTLSCLGIVSESDLESTTDSYVWENQTTGATISSSDSITLDTSNASPNDVIACTFTTTDPSGGTAQSTATATVGNLAPSIDSLSFDSSSVAIGDTITCLSSESDPEGDIPSVTYTWTNETTGTPIGTGASITLSSSMATGLNEISCTAIATDSYGDSDTESVSILVDETTPEFITAASISPSTDITTSTGLSCTAVATDPDGTSISYSYEWQNGSTTLGSSQSISLTPSIVQPTDVVECIVTATDAAGEQETSIASIMVGNTAPTLNSIAITPDAGIDTSTTLACAVNVVDADLETLTPTYAWYNGSTLLGSGSSFTLTSSMAQPNDTVQCVASVTDGYGATVTETASVTIDNTAPVIDSISISPTVSYNDTTMTCDVTSSDADNQSMTTTYIWNNTTQGTTLGTSVSLTLDSNIAARNDVIECIATVTDTSGDTATSTTSITLGNRIPSSPTVTIDPSVAYIDSTLTCIPSGSIDDDGDAVSYSYEWKVNGGAVVSTTSTLSGEFIAGDSVQCTSNPSDGIIDGNPTTQTIVISNAAPVISSVVLAPDPAYTNDTITATATDSDLDGDSTTLTYTWSVDGSEVQSGSTSTLAGTLFSKNQTVSVEVVANDGANDSAAGLASVIINNTLPTTPSVSISPSVPVEEEDDLTCSASGSSDDDGDTISYAFAWTVDGTPYTGSTDSSTTSVIDTTALSASEEWTCTVTPNDGEDDGTSESVSVTVDSGWDGAVTFTNCGTTGRSGPSQSSCDSEYLGGTLEGLVTVNSGVQEWEVPDTGTYQITVVGASGGTNTYNSYTNGKGIQMHGEFDLNQGDLLQIMVGQQGETHGYTGGGGGGTFVALGTAYSSATPLIIAGGGGGAGDSGGNGYKASTGTDGTNGHPSYGYGQNGYGNTSNNNGGWGSSGAGFYGDGSSPDSGLRALSFQNGGVGAEERSWQYGSPNSSCSGAPGGFGGGGSGACNGGGGGGGYSGGGQGGGGGGSYNIGSNQSNGGTHNGHGYVIIDKL